MACILILIIASLFCITEGTATVSTYCSVPPKQLVFNPSLEERLLPPMDDFGRRNSGPSFTPYEIGNDF